MIGLATFLIFVVLGAFAMLVSIYYAFIAAYPALLLSCVAWALIAWWVA